MTLSAGARLGPYEIVSPIGAGGIGEVYRARDPRLNREVAIKVLPASFSDDADRLRRFEQEAQAAGALNHPNIMVVYDIGSHEGAPYVVGELLEGETLRMVLAGGELPPRLAADYALQLAQGLAAAHDKGIVHRDLKPENLFVTKDRRLKILDFGLAKFVAPESLSGPVTEAPTTPGTEPGVVMGTLDYMAPEQTRGRPADVRSDIFAFGAILYEMLSGQRAFRRDSAADTISAILKEDLPGFAAARQDIPPGLDRIVRHCLEKKPEHRFQSAHDLAFDLSSSAGEGARVETRPPRWVLALFGGVLVGLVVVIGLLLWRARTGQAARPGSPDRRSIAVLPLQNLSPDPENAFFADGMTEDILTQLAKIRDLKVISRTSVMRYKGTQKPVREIASELGVATVLEGSVRRAGNRVRIAGQLVDARTDEHLWAETYDRELKDVFAIQSDVAQQIAGALRATLSPAEKRRIEQSPTRDLAAYDQYLKGRELYYRYRKSDNETAIALFQKALALDASFALAYAGLGDAYAQRVLRFGSPHSELQLSFEMSRKAISLDSGLSEGYKALGLAHLVAGAYRESLDANKRAVDINPNHGTATANLGAVLRFLGRFDEALPWYHRAADLDPRNAVLASAFGVVYTALGDARQAERWSKRSLELQADLGQGQANLIYFYLHERRYPEALQQAASALTLLPDDSFTLNAAGTAELLTGNLPRAEQLFGRALPLLRGTRGYRDSEAGIETHLAFLRLRAGRGAEAEALLKESLSADHRATKEGNQDWSIPYDTACVHALRGEKDEAYRWLDKAVEAGWRGWPLGTRSPLLDSLRTDLRFHQLESQLETLVNQMRRRAGLS